MIDKYKDDASDDNSLDSSNLSRGQNFSNI